jgi:hypothetical protein
LEEEEMKMVQCPRRLLQQLAGHATLLRQACALLHTFSTADTELHAVQQMVAGYLEKLA